MNQHQALANLHKVVQICNSGINLKQPQQPSQALLNSNSSAFQNQYQTIQNEKPGKPLNESSSKQIKAEEPKAIEPSYEGTKVNSELRHQEDNVSGMMITAVE